MSIVITTYTHCLQHQYDQLLRESCESMFTHSLKYKNFLDQILPGSTSNYLCCLESDKLVASLPLITIEGPYGKVINSLPYFGSHGGIVSGPEFTREMRLLLMEKLHSLTNTPNSLSCTLIESPFGERSHYLDFHANLHDERIGQITSLPAAQDKSHAEQILLNIYHQKTRNAVRKGLKGGFEIGHEGSIQVLRELHDIHTQNILAIGGVPKQWNVFEAIARVFEYDSDYRIYVARKGGQIVSALLLFYFKDMVEYFTPATLASSRSDQPLSALIYRAMVDATFEKKAKFWNWGGTWLSQKGVYQFKSRWGTTDYPYRYHTKLNNMSANLQKLSKESILESYKNFFVIPFHALQ